MSTERPFPRGQVVVCQYDFNFHLTYVNPAFARMLGYSREELVGQPLKRIAHPGIPQALLDDIRGFDQAAGYPFAWFFTMLTSRKVPFQVGEAVLADLAADFDYLPPRDALILGAWSNKRYAV